jgi:hypothetical protein
MTGSKGWLETEWFEGLAHESGMPARGSDFAERRAFIVVRKSRKRDGAKGGRKVDE